MSTARKNSLTRLLEESVSHRVIETAPMPVQIAAGEAVSKLERYGPAGVGAATALLAAVAASPVAPIWRLRIAGERHRSRNPIKDIRPCDWIFSLWVPTLCCVNNAV